MPMEPIRVDGLKEFTKALKRTDADLPKAVRVAANEAAGVIVTTAQGRVPSRSGAARRSIKARSTRTAARVSGGSKRVPYYGWLDFGGRVGRRHAVRRPFRKTGRYIWRAYEERSGEVYATFNDALIDVARRAGLEVSDG